MAYFAEINNDGTVIRVLKTDDSMPKKGLTWLEKNFGGTWVETHKEGGSKKLFAAPGFTYDSDRDVFISKQPFSSWTHNDEIWAWEAPVPSPGEGYVWDEDSLSWVEVTEETE